MKKIALAVDFSRGEELLLNKAAEVAKAMNSKIWLIHITEPEPEVIGVGVDQTLATSERTTKLKRDHAKMDDYVRKIGEHHVMAETVMVEGMPVDMLMREINKYEFDLLIIGNHQHNAFYRTFIGSVLSELMKIIDIPVLAVPLNES